MAGQLISITETSAGGSVPELKLENRGDRPVLLLALLVLLVSDVAFIVVRKRMRQRSVVPTMFAGAVLRLVKTPDAEVAHPPA